MQIFMASALTSKIQAAVLANQKGSGKTALVFCGEGASVIRSSFV
jgi:hypothetical protein